MNHSVCRSLYGHYSLRVSYFWKEITFPKLSLQAIGIPFIDGKSSFKIIIALLLLPEVLLPDNLSIPAYISATGVLASIVVLGSILWVALFGDIG